MALRNQYMAAPAIVAVTPAAATNANIPRSADKPWALLARPMLFRSTTRGKRAEKMAAAGATRQYHGEQRDRQCCPRRRRPGSWQYKIGGDEAEERGQCANERVADRLSGEILAIAQWREQDARQTALVDGELVEGNGKDGHAADECAKARDGEAGIHVQPGRKMEPCGVLPVDDEVHEHEHQRREEDGATARRAQRQSQLRGGDRRGATREPGHLIAHARRVGT